MRRKLHRCTAAELRPGDVVAWTPFRFRRAERMTVRGVSVDRHGAVVQFGRAAGTLETGFPPGYVFYREGKA